ncbi:Protein of unknown function [Terribacillus halophilus]|uniref:DUF2785 domain-containing protein n=1 Tax=Terribacillus halophilus TaxID=361279 RepID=A0A1G6HT73_9BACI|nr:DUF2785 domain-containing protein [Terribacillus halophilus]SDB97420.1 Protein of unknown function [Terribacillus halophilus]
MDREVLKQKLTQLRVNDQIDTAVSMEELLFSMLPHIGDHDPSLRDELIYGSASNWITEGLVSPKVMSELLVELLTDRYLFNEEKYTRSFATLWIAAILFRHRNKAFLSESVIEKVYQALLAYIQQETVGGGYDETFGWLHTLAHAADALDELILLTELTVDHRQQLVKAVIDKMAFPYHILSHEEDERMTIAIHSAVKNGLDPAVVGFMVKDKASQVIACWPDVKETNLRMRSNFKQFIRSMYFCFADYSALRSTLYECEQLFSGIYHQKPSC